MTFDQYRNKEFLKALSNIVTNDSVVLDLGAGLGVLGFLAAKLGAKKVYLVEPEDVISIAKEIAKQSNLLNKIELIQGKIEDINIDDKVDIIISIFTGNFLLTEDLLPLLFQARDKYLKEDGILIPSSAYMIGVPVSAPSYYKDVIDIWSEPHLKLDFSAGRKYAANSVYYPNNELKDSKYLSEPKKLFYIDFYKLKDTTCKVETTFEVTSDGVCHGICGWFDMMLGNEWFSTNPHISKSHWSPAFLPLDPPLEVKPGDELVFKLSRLSHGDWNWSLTFDGTNQNHSTLYSFALNTNTLKKASLDYTPNRSERGDAVLFLLSQINGSESVESLAKQINKNYPNMFTDYERALFFVRSIIKWAT